MGAVQLPPTSDNLTFWSRKVLLTPVFYPSHWLERLDWLGLVIIVAPQQILPLLSKFVLGYLAEDFCTVDMFHSGYQCVQFWCQWPFGAAAKTDIQKTTPWSAVHILVKFHPDQNTPWSKHPLVKTYPRKKHFIKTHHCLTHCSSLLDWSKQTCKKNTLWSLHDECSLNTAQN